MYRLEVRLMCQKCTEDRLGWAVVHKGSWRWSENLEPSALLDESISEPLICVKLKQSNFESWTVRQRCPEQSGFGAIRIPLYNVYV